MTFLVYNSHGVMIGSGYSTADAANKAASAASRRDTLEMYSVYELLPFVVLVRQYRAGQKVERALVVGQNA